MREGQSLAQLLAGSRLCTLELDMRSHTDSNVHTPQSGYSQDHLIKSQ